MSDADESRDRSSADPDSEPVPGETPADPAYAAGAGFSGEATGATPPDPEPEPTAGPDPAGSSQPAPSRPQEGGGSASVGAPAAAGGTRDDDAKTMAMIAHVANIVGVFTGGLGNLAAVILAFVKKDSAPDWVKTHFVLVIRTVLIALIASIALIVLSVIAVPLLFAGVGFVMFPLIALCWVALCVWIVARSVVGLMKLNNNEPHPNPETWLI